MNYSDSLVKSLTTAVIASGVSQLDAMTMFPKGIGQAGKVNFIGGRLSFPIAMGIAVFLSNYLAELVHSYILPHISSDKRVVNSLSSVITLGSTFGATYVFLNTVNSTLVSALGLLNLALIVGLAEVSSTYVFSNYISPWLLAEN